MNGRKTLRKYFSPEELDRINRHGYRDEQILAAITDLFDNHIATEATANEVFFEVYPDLLAEPPTIGFGRNGSEFVHLELHYLWKPYLQLGEYLVIFGSSGTGKTFFTSLLCAGTTSGTFPTGERTQPGNVLYISGEETFDEIIDRLIRCGGDPARCYVFDCTDSVGLNIDEGFDELLGIAQRYSPKLIVLDPWQCFLGKNVDMNRQNVLRPILQRLSLLAKKINCAIVVVSHINKKDQGSDANFAASGSNELINASRSAIRLIEDEEDEDRRIAVHTKSNHAKRGDSLCFRFNNDGTVQWDGTSEIDKNTLELAARSRKSPGEVIKCKSSSDIEKQKLIAALTEEAENTALCGKRITYEEMKLRHGQNIFNGEQPKRVLDSIESSLKSRDILIKTGLQVRRGSKNFNGFFIQQLTQM